MRFCYTTRNIKRISSPLLVLVALAIGHASYAQWTQIGADIDGEAAGDESGYSVALSSDGNRLAIGAPKNGGAGAEAGHVRVYSWDGATWVQLGTDIDGEAAGDKSGRSVALSSDGNRLAVGAAFNSAAGTSAGHVRVYDWDSKVSNWTQAGADIDGEAAEDLSGISVALSSDGNRLAIGAPGNDGEVPDSDVGHVRVFEWRSDAWRQLGTDIDGEAAGDDSGVSVALSADGNRLSIGASGNDGDEAHSNKGHVRVYDWWNNSWLQVGADIDGEAAGDESGVSIALSADGTRLAVGANENDGNGSNAGHVRVYYWLTNSGSWLQSGADIDGEELLDESGRTVALSADGSLVAVGAHLNDADAGHVRLYDWTGAVWPQVGPDIDGENLGDHSGWSIALSSDGSRLAIGAPFNDDGGTAAGHVRVFDSLVLLPVELLWFNAEADGQSAVLTWETAFDIDNSGFEVQIKKEESSWQTHGFVSEYGTTPESREYGYTATGLTPGKYSFRLKQVRFDGRFGFSETLELDIDFAGDYFLGPVYPNPIVSQGKLRFAISGTEQVEIWVYDMLGRKTQQLHSGEAFGGSVKSLEFTPDRLPPGQYLVRLESRGRSLVQPMVVVK